jgi:REP element-mobilizing transposase RayT
MTKIIGYMVTWTTYGSWLQGDNRGYVKHGKILPGNQQILLTNRRLKMAKTVKLNPEQRIIVQQAVLNEAKRIGQTIEAIAVCEHHVHIVARPCQEPIQQIVSRYKNVAMFALCKNAAISRIWTRGFDKRFCFTEEELKNRINYVRKHPPY